MPRSERHLVAHLLRRAGFGASAAELDAYAALGFEGAVDRLLHFERVDDSALEARITRLRADNPAAANPERPEFGNPPLEVAIWLSRMIHTQRPLQEKMTLYWHGLLVSSIRDVNSGILMHRQNELFRQHALTASYKELIGGIARDPAMLLYLDNSSNKKGKPNENWARELMELFTLGIGNYTESDVKDAARAFTGWTFNRQTGQFAFNANQHDNDPKTVLGVTGNLNGDDVINILFTQPAHDKYMMRRLVRNFVYETQDEPFVSRLAGIYRGSNFNIKETMRALLLSPEFKSDQAVFALVKSPAEFAIGALRALSANVTDLRVLLSLSQALSTMGQQIYAPPDVGGWPGGRTWFNSTTWYNRANLTRTLAGYDSEMTVDPAEMATQARITTPQAAIDYFLEVLAQSEVPAEYKGELLKFTGTTFKDARDRDGKLRGLVRLIMSSPAYQLN